MKTINLSIIIASLFFLFGCNDNENSGNYGPIVPEVYIEYVDKEGNPIMNESDIRQLYEKGERLEDLSITDDKGTSFMTDKDFGLAPVRYVLHTYIFEIFNNESPKVNRYYTVRYQVPQSWRDSIEVGGSVEDVEELKLVFHVNGGRSQFTKVWYNGKEISRFVTPMELDPNGGIPGEWDQEAVDRIKKELLYNGDTVAYIINDKIRLILPVERTK